MVHWIAGHEAAETVHFREAVTLKIEEADRRQRESGLCEAWYDGADKDVRGVAGGATGLLMQQLLAPARHKDEDYPNPLRVGRLFALLLSLSVSFCYRRRYARSLGLQRHW